MTDENVIRELKAKDGAAVSELMKVFTEDKAYIENFPLTSTVKKRYKETKGVDRIMCEITQKICNRGAEEGKHEFKK